MELNVAIKADLNTIRDMVEFELNHQVISKSEQPEVVMARRMFVNLVHNKYGLRDNSLLMNKPLLAEYMGLNDPKDVNYLLNGFEMYIQYNHRIKEQWIKLKSMCDKNSYTRLKYLKNQLIDMKKRVIELEKQISAINDEQEKVKANKSG